MEILQKSYLVNLVLCPDSGFVALWMAEVLILGRRSYLLIEQKGKVTRHKQVRLLRCEPSIQPVQLLWLFSAEDSSNTVESVCSLCVQHTHWLRHLQHRLLQKAPLCTFVLPASDPTRPDYFTENCPVTPLYQWKPQLWSRLLSVTVTIKAASV